MIITKTPLRMSYVGGGSDMPSFYREHGGAVISSAIKVFVYILVKDRFEKGIRLSYSKTENVIQAADLEHPIVRNALELISIKDDIEIISIADIPSFGTGLGSSSSFSVGLINALSTFQNIDINRAHLAESACHLEIDLCGSPIGKQDQYAASYGGLKVYRFNCDDTVSVEDVLVKPEIENKINEETIAFYVGGARDANVILAGQQNELKIKEKINSMKKMVRLVDDLKREFEGNSIENFGPILHENWLLKRGMSKDIANPYIDDLYEAARSCGVKGGKLLGAGGGGFMIFHAPTEAIRLAVREKFKDLKEVNFNIEHIGSRVLEIN
ncbi:GHMP kinase [Amylibacter sp.]|nr:GHMP kinase [Amylibacter sp.]